VDHRLFIAARVVSKAGIFKKGRADAPNIPVAQDAKTSSKKLMLDAITFDILSIEKSDQSVCNAESLCVHKKILQAMGNAPMR
jgi:hypothetical protein